MVWEGIKYDRILKERIEDLKYQELSSSGYVVDTFVGGLVGIYYGIESIDENWKKHLKRHDYIMDLCEKFDRSLEK